MYSRCSRFSRKAVVQKTSTQVIELAVEALLSSPSFLMRVEREPAEAKGGAPYRLRDLDRPTACLASCRLEPLFEELLR
jgi:hypothetical protein